MATTIYHPSLVLGQIVDPALFILLGKVDEAESKIEASRERFNAAVRMKRSLMMTVSELTAMDLDVTDLREVLKDTDQKSATATTPLSKAEMRSNLTKLLDELEDHYGVKPMIYTNYKYFYRDVLADHYPGYLFWVARYIHADHDDAGFHRLLKTEPDEKAVIWQFSSKGSLGGIPGAVDLNFLHSGDWDRLTIK